MTKKELEAELEVYRKALYRCVREWREKCPSPYWGKPCPGPDALVCADCWMTYRISEARK